MEQSQESRGHYWIQQKQKQQAHDIYQGNSQVQMDCHREAGEPPMDNLLDRSGLFDELVCQILDESQPNKETEGAALNGRVNQQSKDEVIQDNFQGLQMTSPSDTPPLWAKNNEMAHETTRHPKFPPGLTQRPIHPASLELVHPVQGGIPAPTAGDGEQLMGTGNSNETKGLPEYLHPSQLMRGDQAQYFTGNFPNRPKPGNFPSSGGDCGEMPPSVSQFGQQALRNMNPKNHGLLFGRRGSPVPEDPHQYFRQRAAAQQAQSREQFPRQTRAAPPFPNSNQQQAVHAPFGPNVNLKTQLMQANNWADINKFLATKGNLNIRSGSMAFNQNQFSGNLKAGNSAYGQNRLPNYQFPHQNMPSPQAMQVANQSQGTFQPRNQNIGLNGQFQHMHFPSRPDVYNQNMAALLHGPQNDNQTYLSQLHVQLESCYYQFYSMEKERKKTEIELSRLNPGRRISSANTIQTPQMPENPTSLDRMIVDFYKEHSRVYTLMSKIGGLCAEALHPSIDTCLDSWVETIQEAGLKRREELRHAQDGNADVSEQKGYILVDVIEKLAKATRSIRTALWCALQMSKENRVSQNDDGSSLVT